MGSASRLTPAARLLDALTRTLSPQADEEVLLRYFVPGEMFEDADEAGMVPALAAERGGGIEQLLGGRGVGERYTKSARALQCQAQVLLMQLDPEARVEGSLDHPLAVHFEYPRRRKPAHQRLPHLGRVGAGARCEEQRLADRLDRQGDDDLVGNLCRLAVAVAADQRDVLAHQFEEGLHFGEGLFGA